MMIALTENNQGQIMVAEYHGQSVEPDTAIITPDAYATMMQIIVTRGLHRVTQ